MKQDKAYARHVRAYRFFRPLCRLVMKLLLNYDAAPAPITQGPALILSNHVTDLDPILVGCSFKTHLYFVAGENVYRMGILSKFLARYFAPIQRVKGSTDSQSALTILRTLRKGQNVGMFAEGDRSFTGTTLPISPATAKLVKLSHATLVTYTLSGGYLCSPRWSSHLRRAGIRGAVKGVYSPSFLAKLSTEELLHLISADLSVDAYALQKSKPVAFRGKALAERLETALYLCPHCGGIDTLHSEGDLFRCSCGLTLTLDEYGCFHGKELPFANPKDWDAWQQLRMRLLGSHLGSEPAFSDERQTLWRREADHSLTPLTTGRMSLYRDKLVIGCRTFPLRLLQGLAVIQRDGLVFSTAQADYTVTSPVVRCARKYSTLFGVLSEKQ